MDFESTNNPEESNDSFVNKEKAADEVNLPVAFSVGKLAKGYSATRYRISGGAIVDLNTITKDQALELAADPKFKPFVLK